MTTTSPSAPTYRATSLLVVEDEPMLRQVLSEGFEAAGFNVVESETAERAVAILEEDPTIALVFTDVRTPERINGFELAAWIGRHKPDLPVLVTSGDIGAATVPKSFRWQDRLIGKPYRVSEVVRAVRSVLQRRAYSTSGRN